MPLLRGLILGATLLAGWMLVASLPSHHGKLDLGIWYWHTPFAITKDEGALLRSASIDTIYVRTGTFTTDGKHVLLMLPQTWQTDSRGFKIVEVFNFDSGLVHHLGEIDPEAIAADVAPRISKALAESRDRGIEPAGVQLDVDCPTRLLSRYADLLGRIKRRIAGQFKGAWSFSATALPTWLGSGDIVTVSRQVDFLAPQFYENRVGRTLDNVQPVSDPDELARGLRRLKRLGIAFRVGLPAYGHALIYDGQGRLAGMYRGLSAEDALRHPSLSFVANRPVDSSGRTATSTSYCGEDLLTVRAIRPDSSGRGLGATIAYLLPSEQIARANLTLVDQDAPANCQGAILYRFPEKGETTALPLQSLVAAIHKEPTNLGFTLSARARSVPYALIGERIASGVPRELVVTVSSCGNAATQTSPRAFQVLMQFDRTGIGDIAPGDFDQTETGIVESGQFIRTGQARATAILLTRSSVLPGQTLKSGDIELTETGPQEVSLSWVAHGPGGFQTFTGNSPARKLAELYR